MAPKFLNKGWENTYSHPILSHSSIYKHFSIKSLVLGLILTSLGNFKGIFKIPNINPSIF